MVTGNHSRARQVGKISCLRLTLSGQFVVHGDSKEGNRIMVLTRLNGLNVLFVDDRRDARFVVEHILKDAGATVTSLKNGKEAIDCITAVPLSEENHFDVLVMDVNMPVMDGLTATRRLRSRGYNLPILALTCGTMDEDREECFDAGCDEYLSKPIDGKRLVELVFQLAQGIRATA